MRRAILYTFLVALAVVQLFPLLWLLDYSLVKSGELFGPEILRWPNPFQWVNYVRAWVDGRIPLYLWNSTVVVIGSVAASTLFSFMISYACTRMKWRLRGLVYGVVCKADAPPWGFVVMTVEKARPTGGEPSKSAQ